MLITTEFVVVLCLFYPAVMILKTALKSHFENSVSLSLLLASINFLGMELFVVFRYTALCQQKLNC